MSLRALLCFRLSVQSIHRLLGKLCLFNDTFQSKCLVVSFCCQLPMNMDGLLFWTLMAMIYYLCFIQFCRICLIKFETLCLPEQLLICNHTRAYLNSSYSFVGTREPYCNRGKKSLSTKPYCSSWPLPQTRVMEFLGFKQNPMVRDGIGQ